MANRFRKRLVTVTESDVDDRKLTENRPIQITDRATKRVIAPFVRIIRKGAPKVAADEGAQFSFYLRKKPSVLIRDLSSFMSDSVDLPSLLDETAEALKIVTKSSAVSLYMLDTANNEIYLCKKHGTRARDARHHLSWPIEPGSIVAAYVAYTKDYVLSNELLGDDRFPEGVGYQEDSIKSVLCVPVVTPDNDCFAVIEFYRQFREPDYVNEDLKIAVVVTGWMGAAIHQNQQRLALKRQQELNDYLLDLTKCYFAETVMMEKMITEIAKFAKVTLGAERSSFFIIDQDTDEMVAAQFDDDSDATGDYRSTKVRFNKDRGIAGLVAKTGVTVNVKDAYLDPRFNKEIDQKTGFITRSILCLPILGNEGVIGVVQAINKKNGGCFSTTDENLFKTFSIYCSLALHYTQIIRQMKKTLHLNNCYENLLQMHIKPCIHDINFVNKKTDIEIPPDFDQFSWYISEKEKLIMPQYCLEMFYAVIHKSEINLDNLKNCILSCRKLYRKNPYHNFDHAFCVCHCMHAILKRNHWRFTNLEIKALVLAALCHDLDHGGFTNAFLTLVKHDLSYLYEDSLWENHHFAVTMKILKDCQVYKNIDNYDEFYDEIKKAILATDLANYFLNKKKLENLVRQENIDWTNQEHRTLIKGLIMTSCDLSGQCKPYSVAKMITENVLIEFYNQGDLEKKLGLCPLSIMDREKTFLIPEDQVKFLNVVVIPCMDILRLLFPNTSDLYDSAKSIRHTWQDLINTRGMKCWRQDESIVAKKKTFQFAV